jgi:hypothetical protein
MHRSPCSILSSRTLDVRDEAATALGRLVGLVRLRATDVGQRSRQAGATAQARATSAVLALRGRRSPPPWPWLLAGLAVGVAVGVVTGAALASRRPRPVGDTDPGVRSGEPDLSAGES